MDIRKRFGKYALRGEGTLSLVLLVLVFELFAFASPAISFLQKKETIGAVVLPAVLANLTNAERTQQQLGVLKENELLTKAAQLKAEDMASKGYFAHTSPEGNSPWYWVRLVGYDYTHAGENLAVNFKNSEDVTRAWMNSPTHRDNIVRPVYTDMGTGIARGVYKGKEVDFIAQLYANPAKVTTKAGDENLTQGMGATVALASDTRVLGDTDIAQREEVQIASVEPVSFSEEVTTIAIAGVVALIVLGGSFAIFSLRHPVVATNMLAVIAIVGFVGLIGVYSNMHAAPEISQIEYSVTDELNEYSAEW